ncbi:hypothetical protein [Vitiosangium sp. GDMCC 1.1324]|uniref:hypothetical protein n=1 Tax=Vitiosangium sp. (strain GDMCC 1.1324) TaxID=2138576 RepID=UPI000D37CBE1|nr:hypothetical protein [Vitiosangium sp. GDMCC 1.1324]PTL85092.1 hypothetical protein DAT35_04990 [Vitiosangium sp. GDMCC 1.1324]
MRAEAVALRWAALLLGMALLTTGCVTMAPLPGGSGSISALRETAAGTPSLQTPSSFASTEPGGQELLHRQHGEHMRASDVALVSATAPQGPPSCGGQAVPEGWPDYSSWSDEELLAPFFTCTSPAEFLALQRRVDMPRLVEALEDWSAVRLGALGPLEGPAAQVLQRKRFSFLVTATRKYGAYAQVLSLYLLDTAFDDEVRELLVLLAKDKQLEQTLGQMRAVREALEQRGFKLSGYPDRDEQPGDVLRGLGRAADDMASSIPVVDGLQGGGVLATRAHLPPPYQEAFDETERALNREYFAPGHVALGTFDSMTFGVPLGFYYLVAGTGHGAYSLTQRQYEQAARELVPALLLGALYAGDKGMHALSEARGAPGAGQGAARGLGVPELRLTALKEMVQQLEARLGVDGLRELARDIQASREAGRFVAVGGVDAALALREARGNVARAQAMMSKARPGATGAPAGRSGAENGPGQVATVADNTARPTNRAAGAAERPGMASLVDEGAGITFEVVEARLALAELEATGPRLPANVALLEKQRPSLDAPPPGAEINPRWSEYVAYYENRLGELKQGKASKGPLRWDAYERMWGWFARGLHFERLMVALLRADATLPKAQRRFLADFDRPRIERYVGVWKPKSGLRFADVLIIEEGALAGRPRRVETFSFKSRDLALLEEEALKTQMLEDAREALRFYGETLDIRRPSLQPLLPGGSEVPVQRVRLVYEGGSLLPKDVKLLDRAVEKTQSKVPGVEVLFQ